MIPKGYAEIIKVYGDPVPFVQNKGSWQSKILKKVDLKGIALPYAYAPATITQITGHTLVVPTIRECIAQCIDKGVPSSRLTYGGIYCWRPTKAGNKLSTHTWGIAIDIDPVNNPWNKKWVDDGIMLHPTIIEVFTAAGFLWGNGFKHPDPMHFQLASGY